MSAEQILDAMNQLPDDLIAAADALRQRKKSPILWKRLVPIAACFVLVLGALYEVLPVLAPKGSDAAAPEAAAPMEMLQDSLSELQTAGSPETNAEPEAPAEGVPREESATDAPNDGAPLAPEMEEVTEELSGTPLIPVTGYSYCIGAEEPDETEITILSTWREWNTFLEETPRLIEEGGFKNHYEETYFEEQQLIAVVTTAASSSVYYEVDSIVKTGTGTWELYITQFVPEWFTDDMTQQLLLIELPRTVEPEDEILLNLDTVAE